MSQRPTLETERLVLRPFQLSDASDVQRLAGSKDIASTTLHIPHPYEDGMAEDWIGTHQGRFDQGTGVVFAITSRADCTLIGAISLMDMRPGHRAELGYWIGRPYWGQGFCTEASRAVVGYGFEVLGLNRIHACHLARNPASGRVMQKLGMRHEGCRRQHVQKWGAFEDLEMYGILKRDWETDLRRAVHPALEADDGDDRADVPSGSGGFSGRRARVGLAAAGESVMPDFVIVGGGGVRFRRGV